MYDFDAKKAAKMFEEEQKKIDKEDALMEELYLSSKKYCQMISAKRLEN